MTRAQLILAASRNLGYLDGWAIDHLPGMAVPEEEPPAEMLADIVVASCLKNASSKTVDDLLTQLTNIAEEIEKVVNSIMMHNELQEPLEGAWPCAS